MIDKIFIVHYEPLKDRKIYLDLMLPKLNIPYEYIISNDENDSLKPIEGYYKVNPYRWHKMLVPGEIFVSINHFLVYKKIIECGFSNCLIIEDDAVFKDKFLTSLNIILDELKNIDYDMCFLSDCSNLHSNSIQSDRYLYKSDTSRSVCGYIVNSKCLSKVIETLPFSAPIDWHLNQIRKDLNLQYYWSEPTIIGQGSENIYKSNLRDKIK